MSNQPENNETAAGAPKSCNFAFFASVEVGTFDTIEELEKALATKPCGRTWDSSLPFLKCERATLHLVEVRGTELGQKQNLSRREICELAVAAGLMMCPQEVAPQIIIQDLLKPNIPESVIGSIEPIRGQMNLSMTIESRLTSPWVHCQFDPVGGFSPQTWWLFVNPNS